MTAPAPSAPISTSRLAHARAPPRVPAGTGRAAGVGEGRGTRAGGGDPARPGAQAAAAAGAASTMRRRLRRSRAAEPAPRAKGRGAAAARLRSGGWGRGPSPGGRAGPERGGRCPVPSHARAAAGWAARAPVESLTYAVDELVAPRVQFLPKAASLNGALLPPTHPRHLLPPARPCLRRGPAHAQPRRPGPRTHPWPGRRAFRRGRRGGKAALTSPWPRGGPGWPAPPPGQRASPRSGSASHGPTAPERRLPTPALGARAALAPQQGHGYPGPPRGFWFLK